MIRPGDWVRFIFLQSDYDNGNDRVKTWHPGETARVASSDGHCLSVYHPNGNIGQCCIYPLAVTPITKGSQLELFP